MVALVKSIRIEFKGLDKLQAKLLKASQLEEVERVVKTNGVEMQKKAVSNAVFTRGYSTGATKRSISVSSGQQGKYKYRVMPGTEYAAYVELGTRKMSAQPFIKPAFEAQKGQFKAEMEKLVK